jgi:2'-5' RNA ligase
MYALQAEIERICQRIGLPPDPRKFTPHVTLARLKSSRVDDVVHYLAGRGNFQTASFTVPRFVLLSSRDSVGGGPYLTEEVFPLREALSAPSVDNSFLQPAKSLA